MNREEPRSPSELEEKIGYCFKREDLLLRALTHSSYANEENVKSNERLEFLGDSVLSLVVSTYIFDRHHDMDEGELSKIRAYTVCEKALAEFARTIDLGSYLRMGHGEEITGGRNKPSITSDAFEALIGAMYLDSGLESAEKFILPYAVPKIAEAESEAITGDYKSALKQIVEAYHEETLEYVLVSEEGPSHDRTFVMEARLNSNVLGRGSGKSKREAEQRAAKEALKLFGQDTD